MNKTILFNKLQEAISGVHDEQFTPVIEGIHTMGTRRTYAILNAVVSSMDEDELYVEVGTYQGGSLVSAMLGNQARAIGVDAFSEFKETNSFERTQANLERYGVNDRVVLRNMTYQDFFASVPADFKMQVYYYDGEHNYQGQLAGMEAGWEFLSAGSIMLVDDYLYREVTDAVNSFIARHPDHIRFLFVICPSEPVDPIWWNGCVVLEVV